MRNYNVFIIKKMSKLFKINMIISIRKPWWIYMLKLIIYIFRSYISYLNTLFEAFIFVYLIINTLKCP